MKKLKLIFWLYVAFDLFIGGTCGGLFPLTTMAGAQTVLSNTTLGSALKDSKAQLVNLASVTGVVAGTDLYVDSELMQVEVVPSAGTVVTVIRGYGGTKASSHANGAFVFIVPAAAQPLALVSTDPQGSCARGSSTSAASTLYLPIINTRTGYISDCLGGYFTLGDPQNQGNPFFHVLGGQPGGTIYTSLNSTGTTLAATTMYCSELDLLSNKIVTGIGIMNGTTVGTDKHLVALYDASGNLLANSATAGATSATASNYQNFAFTSSYFAVGPAQYFTCMQTNGTTDTVRMLVTQVGDTLLTKGVTGITFGTVPATITVPTTFTTAVGPYAYLY